MRARNKFDYYGDVLTKQDVCYLLNYSPNTVSRLLNEGKIKGKRDGREWRILKQSVIDYLNG